MVATIASYSETNQDNEWNLDEVHASTGNTQSIVGQTFQTPAGDPYKLASCKFYLKKSGSPTGNLTAVLYAHTGTFGTNGKPTGAAIATSDAVNAATLTGAYQLIEFTFTGVNQAILTASTNYCIGVKATSATINAGNYVIVGGDWAGSNAGNCFYYNFTMGGWNGSNSMDMCFYVYGDLTHYTRLGYSTEGASLVPLTADSDFGIKLSTTAGNQIIKATVSLAVQNAGALTGRFEVYKASDLSLLGSSEAKANSLTSTFTWFTHYFDTPVDTITGDIWLLYHFDFDAARGEVYAAYDNTGAADTGEVTAVTYASTPANPHITLGATSTKQFSLCMDMLSGSTPTLAGIVTTGKLGKYAGYRACGNNHVHLATDFKAASTILLTDDDVEVSQLTVYACGSTAKGVGKVKGALYDVNNVLIAVTQERNVVLPTSPTLIVLPFANPLYLNKGTYYASIIETLYEGTTEFIITLDDTTGSYKGNADTYTDDFSATFGTATLTTGHLSLFMDYYVSTVYPGVTAGNVVSSSNITRASVRYQEKAFYAAGRIWAFWTTNESLAGQYQSYYSTSLDNGVTWATPISVHETGLEFNGENLQAIYEETNSRVHVFARNTAAGLYYRSGTPNSDGSITWNAAWVLFWAAATGNVDFYAAVDSYGYPYCTWGYAVLMADDECYINKAATNNGLWASNAAGYPLLLSSGAGSNYVNNNWLVSLKNGKMYAFYCKSGEPILGRLYDGVTWKAEETVSTLNIGTQYAFAFETWARSCYADDNDTIHLAFLDDGGTSAGLNVPFSYNIQYLYRTLVDGWSSEDLVQDGIYGKGVIPSITVNNGFITIYYINDPVTNMIVSKSVDSDYNISNFKNVVDERTAGFDTTTYEPFVDYGAILNGFVKKINDRIGLLYVTGAAGATHSLKFSLVSYSVEQTYLDAKWFARAKEAARQSLGITDFNVTLKRMHLGSYDTITGIPAILYTDSTVEAILVPKGVSTHQLGLMHYTTLDATALLTAFILQGDLILDSIGRVYRVMTRQIIYLGNRFIVYICDLKEQPTY